MPKIYFLGGLGLDTSIVNDISLGGQKLQFVDWERPLLKDTLKSYSARIISKYCIEAESIIIGVSFGGLIALEIGKIVPLKKVVLVSSFSEVNDLPHLFRIALKLRLYRLFPPSILQYFQAALNYYFSISSKSDAKVLKNVIKKTDPVFLNWALKNILSFRLPSVLPKIVRIHGDNDRIIKKDRNQTDYVIQKAGHFMIFDKKDLIVPILEKAVSTDEAS